MLARLLAATVLLCAGVAAAQTPARFIEGADFVRIDRAFPVTTGDKVEVLEAFSYSCIHCAEANPHVKRWQTAAPANAQLVLMPIPWNPDWEVAARAYFAADILKALDRTHQATFDARWQQRKTLATAEDYANIYAELGVDRAKFLAAFKSFAVNTKVARNNKLAGEYGISSTPTFIIDGKFRLNPKSHADLPDLINFVVDKAAAERAPAAVPAATPATSTP